MVVLVICKNEEDPLKKKEIGVGAQDFPNYDTVGAIFCFENQYSDPILTNS